MSATALHELTIAEASRLLAARKLSPVEMTQALLARIERVNPLVDAYLCVTADRALAAAPAAEKTLAAGTGTPLTGIPLAYKDMYETAGVPTTAHSRILRDNVPAHDAEAVRRLAAAGAVMLGKLATHEFALGGPAFDLPWPPARNPWDRERFTGGSSSGSGAAVAAGLAPGSLGTDTAGSIRLPAGWCGVAGIKPTPGLVSRRGVLPLAPGLDTAGPLAWTAEDCAILLDAIAGHDPADPASVAVPPGNYAARLEAPLGRLRVGVVRRFHERDLVAAPEMRAMVDAAARTLEAMGCIVEEATLPPLQDYDAVCRLIMTAEAYALHERTMQTRPGDYSRFFRSRVMGGALIRAADYIAAQRMRGDLTRAMDAAFQRHDVLMCATTPGPAPLLADLRPDEAQVRPLLTTPANVAAIPALSVCGGFSAGGLPLGLQMMGPAWSEARLLRLAHQFERAAGTRARRPAL